MIREHVVSTTRQSGLSLPIALIMLAALMIGSVALIKTVDTATLVAGNLAFKHSATLAAERGIQIAVAWLNAQTPTQRNNSNAAMGYCSSQHADDDTPAGWDPTTKWTGACTPVVVATDVAGNKIEYMIHRLCRFPNAARLATVGGQTNFCSTAVGSAGGSAETSSKQSGYEQKNGGGADYVAYRITIRVLADRGTRSYIQTTVLLPA